MVIIQGKGFLLRPIRASDAQGYLECHRDEAARLNFTSVPTTLAEAKKEIIEGRKKCKKFAIIVDGRFAGYIKLDLTTHPRYKHSANIGYGIHEECRGKGLATKAVKAITAYGFEQLGLVRISGMCRSYNKASARVLEKAGFKLEGMLRKNKFMHGKYIDDLLWAKVR